MRQPILAILTAVAFTLAGVEVANRDDAPLIRADGEPVKVKPAYHFQTSFEDREVPAEYAALWRRLDQETMIRAVDPADIAQGGPLRGPICGTDLRHTADLVREAILLREPFEVITSLVKMYPMLSP